MLVTLCLLGTVLLGGLVGGYSLEKINIKLVLSFSGAFLLGLSFLHIIPELFEQPTENIGYYILFGFGLQLLLEHLSKGIEHGHSHKIHGKNKLLSVIPIMIGLSLHSFLEGIPINSMSEIGETVSYPFLLGICLHKFPAAIVLTSLLLSSNYSKMSTIFFVFVFGIMSPLGFYFSTYLENIVFDMNIVTALVLGSFLHISTTIIFESDESHSHSIDWSKMLSIIFGFAVAILLA